MSKAAADEDQALLHTAYYETSTCPIKDDVPALAACWKTGAGPLTKQEAGLLLWHHCQQDEGSCAEVLGCGVLATCLDTLGSPSALAADKSTAAGLLLALCADDNNKEQVARCKASGANGSSCCQVLHACLANPQSVPRHVVAVLANLAALPASLSALLKAMAGEVPWARYAGLLAVSHCHGGKDHATAISTAQLVQCLVSGRDSLAIEAAAAGLLQALLDSTRRHKSAAAVAACASCLQTMCQAAPQVCSRLGELPGAMQCVIDLLGPPPAAVISWEQEQLKPSQSPHSPALGPPACTGPAAPAAAPSMEQQTHEQRQWQQNSSSIRGRLPNASTTGSATQHVRLSELRTAGSMTRHVSMSGGGGSEGGELDVQPKLPASESSLNRRRKSLRILEVPEGGEPGLASSSGCGAGLLSEGHCPSPSLRQKSMLGCIKPSCVGSAAKVNARSSSAANISSMMPAVLQPPLSSNSTALKWEGPVPQSTHAAVAGLLAELLMLPMLREAASSRLAASRLAVLLVEAINRLDEAAGKKRGSKKAAAKLTIPPDAEVLLTHVTACLELLVAGDNADCFRVAAAGCLPCLAQLATDSSNTCMRRAAKAIVSQVSLLSEAQAQVREAAPPEELLVLPEGPLVHLKLTDVEIRRLLTEHPAGNLPGGLQCLDELTAKARPKV